MAKRGLVFALPGLGDAIMAMPAIEALRQCVDELDAICMQPFTKDYLEQTGLFKHVECKPFLTMPPWDVFLAGLELRRRRYDQSLTLFPSFRWQYHVLTFLAGAKRRIIEAQGVGLLRFLNNGSKRSSGKHNSDRNLSLLGLPPRSTPLEREAVGRVARPDAPVALHVGSMKYKGNENKRWPIENFITLAHHLVARGRKVIVIAGPHELDESQIVADALGENARIIATHDLSDLVATLSGCSAIIGNDSGVVHLAATHLVPTVVLYGLTNPEFIAPRGKHVAIVRSSSCPPCFEPADKLFSCKRNINYQCLRDITVDHVLIGLDSVLVRQVETA